MTDLPKLPVIGDTPSTARTFPPASTLDQIKTFIGDLARPFAIVSTSLGATVAIVIVSQKVSSGDGAIFIGAVLAGVGVLYGAKSLEVASKANSDAKVQVAQAGTPST